MAQLILIRHGQSLWNALNKFTGWVDVSLSERGRSEATIASCRLSNYRVNVFLPRQGLHDSFKAAAILAQALKEKQELTHG